MGKIQDRIKSIVFLNGELPPSWVHSDFLDYKPSLIAADGAAWRMKSIGIVPDIIIGDLDSLKSQDNYLETFAASEIVEQADQETNDFEKALRLVLDRELFPVLVLGMQGGDLEHSFNNWSVLIKLCKELEIWIYEQYRIGIALNSGDVLRGSCGLDKLISLIPQPESRVTTSGLRWSLDAEVLALGIREGARNEIIEKDFSVKVNSGSLLVFLGVDTHVIQLCSSKRPQSIPAQAN